MKYGNLRGRASLSNGGLFLRISRFILALVGCLSSSVGTHWAAASAQEHQKVLRIGLSEINTLDPLFTTQSVENLLVPLVFDPLVANFPDGTMVPRLAAVVPTTANGGISADGKTITYRLRRNVRFHDGAPFTSADVVFTQQAILNPRNNVSSREPFEVVSRVDAPDAYTVVEHLRRPFAPFVVQAFRAILPAHLLKAYPDLNGVDFNASPVGTGPFVFDRWDRGNDVVYHRNAKYFLGTPVLDGIRVRFIPDQNAKIVALQTGVIDWIPLVSESSAARTAAERGNFRWLSLPVNGFGGFRLNVAHPPLDDVRVRRAIQLAIDRATIVRNVYGNRFELATTDQPSWSWAYDRRLAPPRYDPQRSRKLLASAGWRPDKDGKAIKDGKPLSLTLVTPAEYQTVAQVALLAQANLAAVGIDLTIKPEATNLLFGRGPGSLDNGDFDMTFSTFTDANDPDDSRTFSCAAIPPGGFNVGRWCDKAYEKANAVALSHYDRPTRVRAYAQMQRALLDGVPEVFVYSNVQSHVFRNGVRVDERGRHLLFPAQWSI